MQKFTFYLKKAAALLGLPFRALGAALQGWRRKRKKAAAKPRRPLRARMADIRAALATAPQRIKFYWKDAAAQFRKPVSVVMAGMLAALGIALKSLTITITSTLRINFSFLTAALAGYMSGPLVAGVAAMVVDILGYLIAPGGAYHFGFTFNAFLNGILYGLWLYNKPVKLWRTAGAVATNVVVVRLFFQCIWLQQLWGTPFIVLVLERLVKNLVEFPFSVALLLVLLKTAERAKKQFARGKL